MNAIDVLIPFKNGERSDPVSRKVLQNQRLDIFQGLHEITPGHTHPGDSSRYQDITVHLLSAMLCDLLCWRYWQHHEAVFVPVNALQKSAEALLPCGLSPIE